MNTTIESIKWILGLAAMLIVGMIASCLQINSFPWESEIKILSIVFTIFAFSVLFAVLVLIVEIYTLKEEIIEIKNRKSRK